MTKPAKDYADNGKRIATLHHCFLEGVNQIYPNLESPKLFDLSLKLMQIWQTEELLAKLESIDHNLCMLELRTNWNKE